VAPDESTANWSTEDRAFLRQAVELLNSGQYERLAQLLHRVQAAYDQKGDTIPAHVLVLARRICLACSQSQAEADWHQQAREEAAHREDKLRHQLTTLLDLLGERDLSVVAGEWDQVPAPPSAVLRLPAADLPEPAEPLSLWQRIQGVMRWRLGTQPPDEVGSEMSVGEDVHGPSPLPGQATAGTSLRTSGPAREAAPAPFSEAEKRTEPDSPSLVVHCLGPFRVYQDDQLIERWPGHLSKRIFKFMVTHRERPIHQEIFMDLFWRDADPEAARRNLYQAIYSLRQALQTDSTDFAYVLCEDSCYRLNPEMEVWVDCEAFRMHDQDGRRLERAGHLHEAIKAYELAENLYQGEFLAEDLYEDWTIVYRENLRHARLDILDRLSQYYFDQGQLSMAISFCQKILAQDNCREDAHRRLMRCYIYQGQRHLALRQYHLCVEALGRELDVPPMPATLELHQQISTNRTQFPGSQELRDN
jgi:DNA-binding SARP family transcriptional activator